MSFTPTGTPCSGPSGAARRIALARLRERRARVDVRPRAHGVVALGDALQARGDERRRRELAGGDAPRRLGRAEAGEVAHALNTACGSSALTMYSPASTISEIFRSTHRLASR